MTDAPSPFKLLHLGSSPTVNLESRTNIVQTPGISPQFLHDVLRARVVQATKILDLHAINWLPFSDTTQHKVGGIRLAFIKHGHRTFLGDRTIRCFKPHARCLWPLLLRWSINAASWQLRFFHVAIWLATFDADQYLATIGSLYGYRS